MDTEALSQPEGRCPACQDPATTIERCWQSYRILRCERCGLVYAWPREMSPVLYESAYDAEGAYKQYLPSDQKGLSVHPTWAMRKFLKDVKPSGHLLDVGCLTGAFMVLAQRNGWRVAGIEVSSKAASIARDLTGAQVFAGNLFDFRSNRVFDAITMWETLEHAADPVSFLEIALHFLRKDGVLGISVPNWDSPWMRRSTRPEHWPPYHLTFWNPRTLRSLLTRLSLENLTIKAKPFAWEEELGRVKWVYLPFSLVRSVLLRQKGMHLYAAAVKR
jgi:2-polyprenyl-3-methyl-5-hydroxy-6-metoxy-1,4-benzoquinol methylase